MRVLLVNPPFEGVYHRLGFVFPPLGLAYLAAVLRHDGVQVEIVDLSLFPDGLEVLDRRKYDLVGISGDSCRHPSALSVAGEAKKRGVMTVLGGPHVTYQDREIVNEHPEIDFVIRREGEYTLLELVQNLGQPNRYEQILGLTFRGADGLVIGNPDRPFIENLDLLPLPARDLLDMRHYQTLELRRRKITPIVTSRGCPFNCPFCCSSEFAGTRWRTHSVERVLSEIKEVTENFGFGAVAFIDDTFTIDMDRVEKIARGIIAESIDIRWWCFSRPDILLKKPEMVRLMAASGARYVFMGMESGETEILDHLKRGISPSRSGEAVGILRDAGIETMASYMFGDLEETRETAERTIQFARNLPTGAAQFSILTPFPGTLLHEQLAGRIWQKDWKYFDCTHLTFDHPHFSAEELEAMHSKAYRRYYLTPGRILSGVLSTIRGRGVKLSKILPVLRRK